MKNIHSIILAMAAAGFPAAAIADDEILPLRLIAPTAVYSIDGSRLPQSEWRARSAIDLYRNDAGPYNRMSNAGPRARWGSDDVSFAGTPAFGGDILITEAAPMFSAATADGSTPFGVLMLVEIFGTLDEMLDPGDIRDTDHSFLGGFAVEFASVMPGFAYQPDPPIDLTSLLDGGIRIPASSIAVPSNGLSFTVYFYTNNSFTALSDRATLSFSSNTGAGPGGTNGPQVGSSQDQFWFDGDDNGILNMSDRYNLGGGVRLANFGNRLIGYFTPACVGDFNRDGFLDAFDYDDFVRCFEGEACPPGGTADVNGDGFADGFDYDFFLEVFESGC